jgi:hypothetical protein
MSACLQLFDRQYCQQALFFPVNLHFLLHSYYWIRSFGFFQNHKGEEIGEKEMSKNRYLVKLMMTKEEVIELEPLIIKGKPNEAVYLKTSA